MRIVILVLLFTSHLIYSQGLRERYNSKMLVKNHEGAFKELNTYYSALDMVTHDSSFAFCTRFMSDYTLLIELTNDFIKKKPQNITQDDKIMYYLAEKLILSHTYTFRGVIRAFNKDHIGAIEDFNSSLSIYKPKSDESSIIIKSIYYYRGLCKLRAKVNGGCDDLRIASEFGIDRAFDALNDFCK